MQITGTASARTAQIDSIGLDLTGRRVRLITGETGWVETVYVSAGQVDEMFVKFDLMSDRLNPRNFSRVRVLDVAPQDIAEIFD